MYYVERGGLKLPGGPGWSPWRPGLVKFLATLYIRRFSTCGPQMTPGGGPGEPGESLRGARGMIFGLRKAFGNNFLDFFAFFRAKFENQLGKKGVVR